MRSREAARRVRHLRVRKKVQGLPERPRLCVFRSHKHLQVQIVDDTKGRTLLGCSTKDKRLKLGEGGTVGAAQALGELVAKEAVGRGITRVVFDRGGYGYHGRVRAFAEAVRAGGVQV
ncbi:MAG TPA: 50S ribosomal protein L18 [bacterium]